MPRAANLFGEESSAELRALQPVVYRRFLARDIFRLSTINVDEFTSSFSPSFYAQFLLSDPLLSRVAEDPFGNVVGYVLGFIKPESRCHCVAHVCAISVAQSHRGIGVSDALLLQFREYAAERRCDVLTLYVKTSNERALRFYERHGFATVNTIPHYYGEGHHAYFLELKLAT